MNPLTRPRILKNTQRIIIQKNNTTSKTNEKSLTMENLNPNVIKLEYAVRGPLFLRVIEIEKEIQKGIEKPFKNVVKANVGDCHAMGQNPISFIREVLACVAYPKLIEEDHFPTDVKQRASEILSVCEGNCIGSYSPDIGIEMIRKSVANYIKERDHFDAEFDRICLIPGASIGIKNCLQLLVNRVDGKPTGVMVPIPQYPLYSATLTEYGLNKIDYYLDESKNWGLTVDELEKSFENGSKDSKIRAIVVINPGNPTGQVLTKENIENIIKFAYKYKLIIFADEVYQHNIYQGEFHSFKKVLMELGKPYNELELISFMSASKGYMGECGIRGAWMELLNMDKEVQGQLNKFISARLCPTTLGQTVVDCIARPPKVGEPSYDKYSKQKSDILQSLKYRAELIEEMFNKMEGFSCNPVQGAMYAFPRIDLPKKAIEAAKKAGQAPDVFYAFKLLEQTGICVVPGSGFGQEPGTYHFRTTLLPQTEELREMLRAFHMFHENFCKEYC